MSHRRQSFFFILSVPLLLSKSPHQPARAWRDEARRQLPFPLTAPRLQALRCFLFEDPGSALKEGVKVCKRPLVNEVLGLHLTEFFRDPTHKGATPIQRGL